MYGSCESHDVETLFGIYMFMLYSTDNNTTPSIFFVCYKLSNFKIDYCNDKLYNLKYIIIF